MIILWFQLVHKVAAFSCLLGSMVVALKVNLVLKAFLNICWHGEVFPLLY